MGGGGAEGGRPERDPNTTCKTSTRPSSASSWYCKVERHVNERQMVLVPTTDQGSVDVAMEIIKDCQVGWKEGGVY